MSDYNWRPVNNGNGKRIWFLTRAESVPAEERYHFNSRGDLIRYASFESAKRAADRLNERAA